MGDQPSVAPAEVSERHPLWKTSTWGSPNRNPGTSANPNLQQLPTTGRTTESASEPDSIDHLFVEEAPMTDLHRMTEDEHPNLLTAMIIAARRRY